MKNISFSSTETGEQGRYDIFTVNKAGTYLIYGWVKLGENVVENITLMQTLNEQNRTIQKKNGAEIFFCEKVQMTNGVRISIYFQSTYTDSRFHIYEL